MKRVSTVLALAALVVLATAGTAFANFGPHGGYATDTDACAGCHRAHTSFSSVTWTGENDSQHSALLVSSASTMTEFCYACHGDNAPGASTNVEVGVFDSGPSGADGVAVGGGVLYETNSVFNNGLNGGAFSASMTSMHDMGKGAVTDPMWGEGVSAPAGEDLNCASCHDVHGSSNYRLLKDNVNGHTVGGYAADGETPMPVVASVEEGYPIGGWLKHTAGATQMAAYRPNYTTEQYLTLNPDVVDGQTQFRSMSTWCSACHEAYDNKGDVVAGDGNDDETASPYDYGAFESDGVISRDVNGELQVTGATNFVGSQNRHRHPVNVPVQGASVAAGFGVDAIVPSGLPLEKTQNTIGEPVTTSDYLGCLTCHRAHGVDSQMTGWANARLVYDASAVNTWSVEPTTSALAGVNPNASSALLRVDNRGVCERCHNK